MRSFFFTLLLMGSLVALLYPFLGTPEGAPSEDYPTDARILNEEDLTPPPHTLEEAERLYEDSLAR